MMLLRRSREGWTAAHWLNALYVVPLPLDEAD